MEKTICAEFITDTAFRYYFTGMDRSVYYINGSLILARGEDPENTMLLSEDNDLDFEAFQVVAKKMFMSLLYELQGN